MNIFKESPTALCYFTVSVLNRFAMSVISAIYVLFLRSHGLDFFWTNMVNFGFFVTLAIFEVPTGAIADAIGRKRATVCASLIISLGFMTYGFASNFNQFLAAEVLIAIGGTFLSGAFKAWLHDSLAREGNLHAQRGVIAITMMANQVTLGIAAYLGSMIYPVWPWMPFALASIAMALCAAYALLRMVDTQYRPRSARRACILLRQGIKYAWRHTTIRQLMVLGLIQTFALQAPNMQWQVRFRPFFESEEGLGKVAIWIALSLFVGNLVAKRLPADQSRISITLCQTVIGLGVFAAGALSDPRAVFMAFMIHEVARGVFDPIQQTFVNSCIRGSQKRATIISCEALSRDFGGSMGLYATGKLAVGTSIPLTWIVAGSILVAGALLLRMRKGACDS